MQVVHVDLVFDHVEAQVVRLSQGGAGAGPPAGQPHGESVGMVVAAVGLRSLHHGRAPELASPEHQGFIQQPPLLEILDESRRGPIGVLAVLLNALAEVGVLIPGLMEELHETDPSLHQAPGQQAVVGVGGLPRFRPVEIQDGLGFPGDIHEIGHAGLHAKGHLEGVDARGDFGVPDRLQPHTVEIPNRVQRRLLKAGIDALRVGKIEDGLSGAAESHALVDGGQEAAPPAGVAAAGSLAARAEDHEGRQVPGLAAQAVGDPGPQAGPAELLGSGVHQDLAGRVVEGIGGHGLHNGNVVGDTAEVGQHLRYFGIALAVAAVLELGAQQRGMGVDEGRPIALQQLGGRHGPVEPGQLGLVIQQFQVAGSPRHEEKDDVLGLGRIVGRPGSQRITALLPGGSQAGFSQQLAQRHRSQADTALGQKPAAGDLMGIRNSGSMLITHGLILLPYSFFLRPTSHFLLPTSYFSLLTSYFFHSLLMVSSRFSSTRDRAVQAANCTGVVPSGSFGRSSGLYPARSQGLTHPSANRCFCSLRKASRRPTSARVGCRARHRRKA